MESDQNKDTFKPSFGDEESRSKEPKKKPIEVNIF